MTDSKFNKFGSERRPRSKDFLGIDLQNAYTRLGVSPLEPTDDIATYIADLRGKEKRKVNATVEADAKKKHEEEIYRLDEIHNEIGTSKARKKYDEENPQNILLTLQPSQTEKSWQSHRQGGLISEWLLEELGEDNVIPSFNCLKFWSPQDLDDVLLEFLVQFTGSEDIDVEQTDKSLLPDESELELLVLPDDLEKLI